MGDAQQNGGDEAKHTDGAQWCSEEGQENLGDSRSL